MILKTDDSLPWFEAVRAAQCPVCEQPVPWQAKDGLSAELTAEHKACGVRFSLVARQSLVTVMDWHGGALVEQQTADGIELVQRSGVDSTPSPAPRRAVVRFEGSEALDLAFGPRPSGSAE